MVRRKNPPLLQARLSFEATRLSPQHPIEAYARFMPTVRRTCLRPTCRDSAPSKVRTARGPKREWTVPFLSEPHAAIKTRKPAIARGYAKRPQGYAFRIPEKTNFSHNL